MSPLPPVDWEGARSGLLELLGRFPSVTVLSHIRPDPDAIGTSLGVYHLLKAMGKRVEVANVSADLPRSLDFLPAFSRIKRRIDFDDSLLVSCDCGSIDRLGFEGMKERTIVNIDHHASNSLYAELNVVDPRAVSSSEVAYRLFRGIVPIVPESAEAFYAALISDTRHFTTSNVREETFGLASELIGLGAEPARIAQQMLQRRSLASLRVLGKALESLRILAGGQVAAMVVRREEIAASGAKASDLDGVVDYARSLVTVEVAILLVEMRDQIKVSLRSKGADLVPIARAFGGGGHREAAGFENATMQAPELLEKILEAIQNEGVLSKR